jgi:hypothetical protein
MYKKESNSDRVRAACKNSLHMSLVATTPGLRQPERINMPEEIHEVVNVSLDRHCIVGGVQEQRGHLSRCSGLTSVIVEKRNERRTT